MENTDILIKLSDKRDGYLTVNFKDSFRNQKWTKYLGILQKICEDTSYQNKKIINILFDISKCQWIDPLPILSLCIIVKQNSNQIKFRIRVPFLGEHPKTDIVLKFLKTENFFDIIKENVEFFEWTGTLSKLSSAKISSFSKINFNLTYSNASLFPLTIVNLEEIKELDSWIDNKIILKIRPQLIGIIPDNQLDTLIYKIKIFYGETLHNIKKHAYTDKNNSFAGIYTRLRLGSKNASLSNDDRESINKSLREETFNCPRLESEYAEINESFIELFVLDLGVGLYETMKELLPNHPEYPFRAACNLIFLRGKKSRKSTDYTQYGGLFNIGKLFESNYDYLCGKDMNEWVGDFLPFDDKFSYKFVDSTPNPQSHGLAWIGRISPNKNNFENDLWQKWEGNPERHPFKLANIYNQKFYDSNFLPYKVLDFRNFVPQDIFSNYEMVQKQECGNIDTSKVLVFPKKNLSKTGVWNLLEEVCSGLDAIENKDIFIVDIPYYEVHSYISALNEPKFKKRKWPVNISRIFLLTNSLSVCILT